MRGGIRSVYWRRRGREGDVAGLKCFSSDAAHQKDAGWYRVSEGIGRCKSLTPKRGIQQLEKRQGGIGPDSWIRCCQKYRDSCQMSRIRCQTSQALEESSLQSSVENILTEDRFVLFKPLIYIFHFFVFWDEFFAL